MKTHLQSKDQFSYIGNDNLRSCCGLSIKNTTNITQDLEDVTCLSCMQTKEYHKRDEQMRQKQGGKKDFIEEETDNYSEMFAPTIEENPDNPKEKQVGGSWYKKYSIQPIEFILENSDELHGADAMVLNNVLKYLMRHREKNGKEDLEKAIHYIELVKEHEYNEY